MKTVYIARVADNNTDDYKAFFDAKDARKYAEYFESHLTPKELKNNTISLETYILPDVAADDSRSATELVRDMLIDDTFPIDPNEYEVIE